MAIRPPRGKSDYAGLVAREPCIVTVSKKISGDYVGRDETPDELFGRPLQAVILEVGGRNTDKTYQARARLTDPWLENNPDPGLKRLFGAEPPAPYRYNIVPTHHGNGQTRDANLKAGDKCHIWIQQEGAIPWLQRRPNALPSAFPDYPAAALVGFWDARILTIRHPDPSSGIRLLRAVFNDQRIAQHADPRVSRLLGHEPWIPYTATVTNDELVGAGEAMVGDLTIGAKNLLERLKTTASTLTGT